MPIEDPSWPRADQWLAAGHDEPEVLVVGVPTSAASLSPSRADLAPAALRNVLGRFSTFHGEWGIDLRDVRVRDAGDLPVRDRSREDMPGAVLEAASQLPPATLTLFVGGDNAITRPLVGHLSRGDFGRVGLLTLDAHHDVRTLDLGPTNGSPVRGLIEDGLPGGHVAQVGIHSFANSREYREYCDREGVAVFTMEDVERLGVEEVVAEALARLAARCEWIHVDVDIDVLDRAYAPACPGARPGGMTPRQLASAALACGAYPKVVSVDFVEVDPQRDRDGVTLDTLAYVLLSAVAGYGRSRR